MARLANRLRNRGRLVGGVHVLVVHRDLGAVDDVERVAGLLSRGQITLQHLRRLWELGGPELALPPSAGSEQAKPLEGKFVWYWICAW